MALTLLRAKKKPYIYLCKRNVITLTHVLGANEQRGPDPDSLLIFLPVFWGMNQLIRQFCLLVDEEFMFSPQTKI